jgi:hypothetical protein
MTPMTMSDYLTETHRQDLLREAQRARLAGEIPHESGGIWTAALLIVADLLLDAGQRLHKHLAHKRLEHAYAAPGNIGVMCCDDGLCGHIVSLDV